MKWGGGGFKKLTALLLWRLLCHVRGTSGFAYLVWALGAHARGFQRPWRQLTHGLIDPYITLVGTHSSQATDGHELVRSQMTAVGVRIPFQLSTPPVFPKSLTHVFN